MQGLRNLNIYIKSIEYVLLAPDFIAVALGEKLTDIGRHLGYFLLAHAHLLLALELVLGEVLLHVRRLAVLLLRLLLGSLTVAELAGAPRKILTFCSKFTLFLAAGFIFLLDEARCLNDRRRMGLLHILRHPWLHLLHGLLRRLSPLLLIGHLLRQRSWRAMLKCTFVSLATAFRRVKKGTWLGYGVRLARSFAELVWTAVSSLRRLATSLSPLLGLSLLQWLLRKLLGGLTK